MRKLFLLKNKLRVACLLAYLLVAASQAVAQSTVVTGVVKDPSGTAIPAVNVLIKGSLTGTTTNANGNFSIEASPQDILVFSFIGYTPQEIRVGTQTVFTITMQEDITSLQEIVVVGYGTQRKSDLTGALSSVSGESLLGSVTASVDQALQGRAAGVQVTQNSGQPGGAVSIRIRGTTSLTQSSEPLYIIDGIQVAGNAQGISGFDWQGGAGGQQQAASNPLAAINPTDIESIEILKDASATAIYGSRAANGVVIVTTKRGKKGEAKLNFNSFYALQEVYKVFDMMDLPTYAQYNNEVAQEVSTITANPNFADPSLLGPGTNWQDAVFRVAPMQSHTLTASGGNENTQYMVSGGYFKQDGIIIGSNFDRFNLRTNIDSRVKEKVKMGMSVGLSRKNETITLQDGGDGVISQAAQMAPHIPVRNFDGSFAGPSQQELSAQVGANPVALALLRNNTVLNNRLMSNMYVDVEFIKGLSFRSEIGVDYNTTLNKAFMPTFEWGRVRNTISQLGQRSDQSFFWLWKNYATYNKSFGSHDITAMAGIEAQKGRWENMIIYKFNVPNDLPVVSQGEVNENFPPTGQIEWNSLYSQFGRINYNYSDRYLVTATIRRDGSSRFGANNRWGIFPSVSAAWRVSNETFFPANNVISNVKLRLGWGQTGNQEIQNYAFGSMLTTQQSYFGPSVRNNAYSNPDVQWEATTMTNIGLDAELWSGRATLTFEAYNKVTDNLLLQVPLPATFGNQVQGPQANIGSMTNKGIELTLTTINTDKGKFRWTSNANISVNRNRVTDMGGTTIFRNLYWYTGFETATMTRAGFPVGQFYGFVMEGIFTSKEEILNHAVQIQAPNSVTPENPNGVNLIERTQGLWLGDIKWKDINNDGVIDSRDQTVIGDPNPDFTFGFNNTFTYGPFTLDLFIIGSVGGDILNYSRARNEQMVGNFDNQSMSVINRARTQLKPDGININNIDDVELINPGTNIPRFDNGGENRNHYMSSRWIEDGTYVRLQNARFSYNLPKTLINKVKIANVQVYANIQNLATITKYKGLDPQIGAFNQSALMQNVDMGRYPAPRVFTFGVNVDF
ncbi:MAG TPA: TonB-dependent receptor [Cyclobacteriaceae bacterium]|nr:TonB-dependent receptor [Cyclobacteriaceae bacterium]HRJ83246.1 TonB-dependent receptor [Cyclobacteriaceae bacterium]